MEKSKEFLNIPRSHKKDLSSLKPHQILIWKERNKSSQFFNVLEEEEEMSMEVLDTEPDLVYSKFLLAYHCYDLIPFSSKLVVLDSKISIKKAFLALIYTGVRAAPLWQEESKKFVGMLTITDFIKIVLHYHRDSVVDLSEFENIQIRTWREVLPEYIRPLIHVGPDSTLCEAVKTLKKQQVHRLPVIDPVTNDVLFIVTHKRILRFLFIYIYDLPEPSYMHNSIEDLNLGSYNDLSYVTLETTVLEAMKILLNKNISGLPVIDSNTNKVVDVYTKFDAIKVVSDDLHTNLNASIGTSLENEKRPFPCVQTCLKTSSLKCIMEKIASAEVHRLVIVNEDDNLVGIISLSDILSFLMDRKFF